MATIVKRGNKFCVVYSYTDSNGEKKQKWETFSTNVEAKKRKNRIEYEQDEGIFVVPQAKKMRELLEEYISVYGVNKWALSTYESRVALINNYINPIIGDVKISDVNTRMIDKFYQSLLKVKSKSYNNQKPKNEFLSPSVVREIHRVLRSAFNQAMKWELVAKNPCKNATLPKEKKNPRQIWETDSLYSANQLCEDELLNLAINLAFACSMRMGEILGLTWDCVDISEKSVASGNAYLFVEKELQRVSKKALELIGEESVKFKFPAVNVQLKTQLVLKEPKTASSVRKVYIPRTVVEMLYKRREKIEEYKELLGDEYYDYNLVICRPNGRPMETSSIDKRFNDLIKNNGLPKVVFHSLRHSSITYKLKLNHGDMKSVQGDSGHAQMKMITDVYSHIIDEDRKQNAQRLEESFYNPNPGSTQKVSQQTITDEQMLNYILSNPEFFEKFKNLIGKS